MRRYGFGAAPAALAAIVAACGVAGNGEVTAGADGADTINGSIRVPAGVHGGSVGTVNGSIHIADGAVVGAANAVNGGINLGALAAADSVTTVNGGVTLGAGARVAQAVTTVNGPIRLEKDAEVAGAVRNVNGRIVLTDAHVAGGLRTVAGNIDVGAGSRVEGGIRVGKASGWLHWNLRKPRIVIGPGAVIQGELRFERDVQLYVSTTASIGPVAGATVIRFTGANPPD